jgi:hypothetical protein
MARTREASRTSSSTDAPSPVDLSSVDELCALVELLGGVAIAPTDTEVIAQIEALERVKAASAAAQAVLTVALAQARGMARGESGRRAASVGSEIGLARRSGPHAGRRQLELADALLHDLPHTLDALARGDISEERAAIIATETRDLTPALRREVDRTLDSSFIALGDTQLRDLVRRVVLRIDAEGAEERWGRARERRRVTVRSLGDGTSRVSAIVAEEHAAAIVRALDRAADEARNTGDERGRDQVKADTVVGRITGIDTATPVPVVVDLVVSAETLLGDSDEPGSIPGVGVVPASLCRSLTAQASAAARAELRRLFAVPGDGDLVAMDSQRRLFPPALAELIRLRDGGICRSPWCSAPIRQIDHVTPARSGGPTSADNGQGLCVTCNLVKEEPGWLSWPSASDGPHHVTTLTPAHHVHGSTSPPLAPPSTTPTGASRAEIHLAQLILAA